MHQSLRVFEWMVHKYKCKLWCWLVLANWFWMCSFWRLWNWKGMEEHPMVFTPVTISYYRSLPLAHKFVNSEIPFLVLTVPVRDQTKLVHNHVMNTDFWKKPLPLLAFVSSANDKKEVLGKLKYILNSMPLWKAWDWPLPLHFLVSKVSLKGSVDKLLLGMCGMGNAVL